MTILSDIEVEQAAQPHTTNKGEKPAGVTPLSSIAPPPDSQSSTSPSAEAPSVKVWSRRRLLAVAAALGASAAAAGRGHAQSYPTRPVRLVLPYTAGSPNDVLARLVAPHLTARLGQSVVVDNRPGGGTTIGVSAVMAAEGDGHTLLFSNSPSHQIAPLVNHNLAYDPLRDFVPLAIVGVSSNVIVIGNDVPATNVRELVAYAKANPGKLNFGFGQGTLPQLVGELFKTAAGLDIANVPYKGFSSVISSSGV